jgi:uncharacterized protein (DUF433 family)
MDLQRVVDIDQDILGGTPVFAGTLVPILRLNDPAAKRTCVGQ